MAKNTSLTRIEALELADGVAGRLDRILPELEAACGAAHEALEAITWHDELEERPEVVGRLLVRLRAVRAAVEAAER